jgi:hypothetical protein
MFAVIYVQIGLINPKISVNALKFNSGYKILT